MLVACALAIGGFLLMPTEAHACRCPTSVSLAAHYQRAAAVVVGTVEGIRSAGRVGATVATVSVSDGWKKSVYAQVTVATESTCAFDFKTGATYVLYLVDAPDGGYFTSQCLGNQPLQAASRAVAWLRKNSTAAGPHPR